MTDLRKMFETVKGRLGLNLASAADINTMGFGDTESGFSTTVEIDMDKLNDEIDEFSATPRARSVLPKLERLPTFEESETACEAGEGTPLHQFIYDNEPAGERDEAQFRDGLTRALAWARGVQ